MPLEGHWRICTPDSVAKEGAWGGFSAVAYFFGKEIQEKTGQPLGLIECAAGGRKIQAFTSLEALQKIPEGAAYVKWWEDDRKSAEAQKASYPEAKAKYDLALAQWGKDYGQDLKKAREEWSKQCEQAKVAHLPFPPRPEPKVPFPQQPSDGTPKVSCISHFNGMIHPIIPYGIKGVIWYQGESNAGSNDYDKLFASMVSDWRERWHQGDFPFLFVQLANYGSSDPFAPNSFAGVRDMQLRSLKIPNTAMAVTIDVGEANDIHPRDKADVGHRLALAARHLVYGERLPFSGPLYDSMKTEGGAIRIAFTHADGGLTIGARPKIYATDTPSVPTELRSFVITGNDRIWHPATAKIEGETVLVSSPEVKDPVAVRYGWENCPDCHLYNGAGLPDSPFRTDDWVDTMVKAPTPPPTEKKVTPPRGS
jgi:sialate O-acetylesterase